MARTKQGVSINEKITKAQNTVARAKEKYELAVKELRTLMEKKETMMRQELLKAIENSNKTHDEILEFISFDNRNE